ncbi:MAG: hypothetical protein PWP23_2440 [Candidatus Sumerlaeota bacterium]|nr:hypothetical protein [Candidatus Sumerlaeota bacterium]
MAAEEWYGRGGVWWRVDLARAIRVARRRCDVLLVDTWLYRHLWPVLWSAARGSGAQVVSFSQLSYWPLRRSARSRSLHHWMTRFFLRAVHAHVGVSNAVLQEDLGNLRGRRPEAVVYPGNNFAGLELVPGAQEQDGAPAMLISVGNYTPRKGFHVLLQALADLAAPDAQLADRVQLRLVGNRAFSPEYVQRLRDEACRLGVEECVILDDWKSPGELSTLLAGADLFLLASSGEGFGIVLADALLHGLPAVVTATPVARELMGTEPMPGCVVPARDPAAMAAAIGKLLELPADERLEMRLRARQRGLEIGQPWPDALDAFDLALRRFGA